MGIDEEMGLRGIWEGGLCISDEDFMDFWGMDYLRLFE